MRIGILLEIATTLGALAGAALATRLPTAVVAVTFGVVLAASAFLSSRPRRPQDRPQQPDPLATRLRLDGSYPGADGNVAGPRRVPEPPRRVRPTRWSITTSAAFPAASA